MNSDVFKKIKMLKKQRQENTQRAQQTEATEMSKLKNTLAVINRSDIGRGNISKLEDSNRNYSK